MPDTKPLTMPLAEALAMVADRLNAMAEPAFADVVRQAVKPVELMPELLAACEMLPFHVLDSEEDGTLDAADFKDNSVYFLQAMREARAALAKAKGETT